MLNVIFRMSTVLFTCVALNTSVQATETTNREAYQVPIHGVQKQKLVYEALEAQKKAYAPYSNYKVGAALMTSNYEFVQGCNIENASYPLTNCAERSAIFSWISQGKEGVPVMMAVVTKDGGSPCGACRQVLNEFNPQLLIMLANEQGEVVKECLLSDLLPDAFGPKNLGH